MANGNVNDDSLVIVEAHKLVLKMAKIAAGIGRASDCFRSKADFQSDFRTDVVYNPSR